MKEPPCNSLMDPSDNIGAILQHEFVLPHAIVHLNDQFTRF